MKTEHYNQEKGRVVGIDIHPSCFAAGAMTNAKPSKVQDTLGSQEGRNGQLDEIG